MIKRELPAVPAPRLAPEDGAHALLSALDRYAATFELMLSAWRDRSIYGTVKDDLDAVAQVQKAQFPEAGVAMMGLAMAHSDIAAVMLEIDVSANRGVPARYGPADLAARRARHEAAIGELRGYVRRKTH